jgi:hypothetical protein
MSSMARMILPPFLASAFFQAVFALFTTPSSVWLDHGVAFAFWLVNHKNKEARLSVDEPRGWPNCSSRQAENAALATGYLKLI